MTQQDSLTISCPFAFAPYILECSFPGDCIHQAGAGSLSGRCDAPNGTAEPVAPALKIIEIPSGEK